MTKETSTFKSFSFTYLDLVIFTGGASHMLGVLRRWQIHFVSCQKQLGQRLKSSTKERQTISIYRCFALMTCAPAIVCLLSLHLMDHELWNLSHWSSLCVSYLKWAIIPYISNRWGHCLMFPFHFCIFASTSSSRRLMSLLLDLFMFNISAVCCWVSTVRPHTTHAAICISCIREVCLLPHLSWMSVYR